MKVDFAYLNLFFIISLFKTIWVLSSGNAFYDSIPDSEFFQINPHIMVGEIAQKLEIVLKKQAFYKIYSVKHNHSGLFKVSESGVWLIL